MARRHPSLLIALALAIAAPACTSYRRDLEPVEGKPAPQSGAAPRAAPAPQPSAAETTPASQPEPKPAPESKPPATPSGGAAGASRSAVLESPGVGLKTVFPHIRIDVGRKLVEFDGRVSPLIFAPYEGRFFYLETFVCKAGTKDHESLVVTDAVPSQIHAALLLIGLEPGHPVTWDHPNGEPVARPAEGPPVDVRFVLDEGPHERVVDPRDWTKVKGGAGRFPEGHWVFAGSAIAGTTDKPFYEADAAGTIVGLASFGTEVISWPRVISAEESDKQLEWVADLEAIPPADTPVVVRVTAVGE